jgi:hypothetical protein
VLAIAGAWTMDPRRLDDVGEPGVGCIGTID